LAVAFGDITCVTINKSLEITLSFVRSRTARCFHPHSPILVVGDGAEIVAVVDTKAAEVVHKMKVGGGRVNTVDFNPMGDHLVVGTDDGRFNLFLES
jgi:WD40 repeat protein